MKSHALVSRRVLAQAAQMGLTPGQPKVLDFLLLHEEADQKTIAAYCEIQQATVGSILLRMEQAGLVLRRQREEAARQTALQASRDKIYADIFAGQVNPFTGKPITSEADYKAWLTEKNRRDTQQQRAQMERKLSDAGLPADALRQIISQEVEHHPAVQQARQATMQAALQSARAVRQRADAAIRKSLAAIGAEFPEIRTLDDIARMPTAGRFNDLVQKGIGMEDAFYLANRQELDQRRRAASRQAAISAAQSKAHLSAGVAGETADAVDVPADMAESYREMMPGATDAQIRKAYASYLKSIGKK